MVTLEKLRTDMKDFLTVDQGLHFVDVMANTVDEALADAAVQLETKPSALHYEIVEKGSEGFMGLGKKPWKLKIYQDPASIRKVKKLASEGLFDGEEQTEQTQNVDGMFFVRHFKSDIMLKIVLPKGNGESIDFRDVLAEVNRQDTVEFDENLVKKYVKQGTEDEYKKVGQYRYTPAGNVVIGVDVTKDEMKALIIVSPPSSSGSEASADMIKQALSSQGVIGPCINEKLISEFVDHPVYNESFEVASALLPENGRDAYVSYYFETDVKKIKAKVSETGNVDHKSWNQIQNVIAGQPLAKKNHAERGKGGKTVMGRYLEATNGKDIQVQLGKNVSFDGDTIKADIDGEVMLVNGRVTVEPVKYLDAVNVKTGDIKFVGTVIVKDSVEEGFKIEATNIEIGGMVDKARLESKGNIIVRQGIFGKGEGFVKAGKSLWAKFINDTTVEVEENVIVYDSIVNSNVTAMKNIVVKGKKAQIIGGHLFATQEICAKNIGSPGGGAETILEVGIDPRSKKRLDELQTLQAKITKEYENCDLDVKNLEQQKQIRKKLPQEKEEKLNTLKARCDEILIELENMTKEINGIQKYLKELKAVGKVKCENTIYADVKIYVRDACDEFKMECKKVTVYYDDESKLSKRGPYEPPSLQEDDPDGYSTD